MSNDIRYGRKKRGIKMELKKQVNKWLDSIEDIDVQAMARKDVIVTGGSIASMLLGEPVNDYDVYFRTKETTVAVAEYYVDQFNKNNKMRTSKNVAEYKPHVIQDTVKNIKGEVEDRVMIYMQSAGIASEDQPEYSYFELMGEDAAMEFTDAILDNAKQGEKVPFRKKYRPIFLSENAITLSDKFQIVVRFYGDPDKIHSNYDFVHAKNYYDHVKSKLYLNPKALEALMSRTLVYEGSLYPVASTFRSKKFMSRGWRISAGQQLKIMWQISEINLNDPAILKEQLTGVDMAYMYQLIQALQSVDPEKINSAYVSTIIDKIFEGEDEEYSFQENEV